MKAEAFLGRWRITREIEDRLGPDARFDGEAVISETAPGRWLYHETGRLGFGTGPLFEAERRYVWAPDATGIEVFFEDGRAFHRIPLAGGADRHHCDPDLYDVTYDFTAWPQCWAIWTVSGPRKSYVMRSRYRQQDLQSGASRG
ncbi:trigger factor [Ponticoccus sp. SC2-23]|uniref:DUF6314 family protein n=1 Tax=Alexandriicola marinus TaxID=2081710 RepID=UPI000FD6CD2E|nr:DUF6314 family protein [Alexandriicola marinus]MBM1222364.1 trigger factor [Ponticoccus sp. SC6-9]MBM1224477.1 trigger factor [Ponticoccus sp. SC6-15]MBM1229743.1 trigger factor [Ponticoccus sp. SC6-38]MBM1233443.1 trigger factor [Ponticoccus sp. SC6-45]MBM1236607.1 trigger factor [Ponticoccus sp. SC6-49]MBM1244651.1 trigger factor [Ponticoccus sp. SC2-64]MBM1246967.1 trigger factor [Ponticoccus sp. SC6-42]MBM1251445.1 trigger factor [Ponticoccus sp. SC6-33]MBM1254616.1 trigger factor [